MAVDPELHVAVGLVRREGCFLLGSRDPDRPGGGIWEFPGGKLEAGETAEAALHRELAEEVGIHVHSAHTYPAYDHRQRDYAVRLYPFLVMEFRGRPRGLEGQAVRWVAEAELWAEADAMPGANAPLLHHLAECGLFGPR